MVRYIIAILFVLTMSVYIHHMAEDPIPLWIRDVFAQVATELIAVPFVLLWTLILITLKYSKPRWDASLLFLVAAIAGNIVGGATAEPLQPIPAADFVVHNTMWIPGHIHFMMATFTLGTFFAVLYYIVPELLGGGLYSPGLAKFHFIGWTVGMGALEAAFKVQGAMGLVRREIAWFSIYEPWFQMAMIGAWLAALSVLAFATNILMTWRFGEPLAPRITPRWVIAGLALEEQSRINEGTHNPNIIYSRLPYPVGLQAIAEEPRSPQSLSHLSTVSLSFFQRCFGHLRSFVTVSRARGRPSDGKGNQLITGVRPKLRTTKILGWIVLVIAAVLWFTAIGNAMGRGFFEDENALQLIVLGGAVSIIAGVLLWLGDF